MKIKNMATPTPPNDFDWVSTIIFLFLAAFGAIAKTAFDIINGKSVGVKIFVCQVIVSMFAGVLSILIASGLSLNFEMTGCLVGSAGWLGGEMVKAIADKMKSNVGGDK